MRRPGREQTGEWRMSIRHSWVFFALGSALFAGLTAFFGKIGVAGINSNLATFIRTIVILGVTAAILTLRAEWRSATAVAPNTWTYLILSGIATGLSWLCYYRALQLGPVSKVAPIDKLSVVFAILLGILVLKEGLTWPVVMGGALIVAGSIVMIAF
jgi:bacterial/archaeal transporter family protein